MLYFVKVNEYSFAFQPVNIPVDPANALTCLPRAKTFRKKTCTHFFLALSNSFHLLLFTHILCCLWQVFVSCQFTVQTLINLTFSSFYKILYRLIFCCGKASDEMPFVNGPSLVLHSAFSPIIIHIYSTLYHKLGCLFA